MAANDYNLDVETQRRIEYTRQKLLKIDQMGEQLRKLNRANRNSEEKLERLVKRKESLELDIARLADATMRAEPEVGTELLNSIEEPMDMDVIYGEAFRKKMCHLKVLLNEIIVRTSINEKAMCKEIGHQEGEFENRLKEAIYGRARANRKVEEAQAKCEVMIREQANLYEDVRELEENLEKYGASRWLLNVEKRRVADILDRTKREPKSGIECRKAYVVPITESSSSSIEDLMTSSASLTHEHVDSDQFDVEHCSERIPELPVHCNPPSSVMEVPNVQIPPHQHHKEGCPKRKSSQLHPIPHSASLISQKVPKKCPVHMNEKEEKKDASTLHLPINGINLMELISKAIEEELYSL